MLDCSNLEGATLDGVEAEWVKMRGANLKNTSFRKANLNCAVLTGSNVSGANFEWSFLNGAIARDLVIDEEEELKWHTDDHRGLQFSLREPEMSRYIRGIDESYEVMSGVIAGVGDMKDPRIRKISYMLMSREIDCYDDLFKELEDPYFEPVVESIRDIFFIHGCEERWKMEEDYREITSKQQWYRIQEFVEKWIGNPKIGKFVFAHLDYIESFITYEGDNMV